MLRDVEPGEIIHVHQNHEFHREKIINVPKHHCIFEYVYFARGDSVLDRKSIHETRERLGRNLAKNDKLGSNSVVVVPVPDSGRSAALGYSAQSKIPYDEGLMKNRYVFRSFITPGEAERLNLVRMKLSAVEAIVKGKEIVLVDDSIVRGTTMGRIIKLLRAAGASKVHVRSSCPPIAFPCFYGIDFPTRNELIFARKAAITHSEQETVELIRQEIGADTLLYQSLEGLIEAIGKPFDDLCLACLNGQYWCSHETTRPYLKDGRI